MIKDVVNVGLQFGHFERKNQGGKNSKLKERTQGLGKIPKLKRKTLESSLKNWKLFWRNLKLKKKTLKTKEKTQNFGKFICLSSRKQVQITSLS